MHQPVYKRYISTWFLAKPNVSKTHHIDFTRIGHYQFSCPGHQDLLHLYRNYRMVLCRVGSYQEEYITLVDFIDGVSHSTTAKSGGKTCHRYRVSEPCAVINVIGADHCPHELLHQIVLFIGAPGRAEAGDAIRT